MQTYPSEEVEDVIPPKVHLGQDAGQYPQQDGQARKAQERGKDGSEGTVGWDGDVVKLVGDPFRGEHIANDARGGDTRSGCGGLENIAGAKTDAVGPVAC